MPSVTQNGNPRNGYCVTHAHLPPYTLDEALQWLEEHRDAFAPGSFTSIRSCTRQLGTFLQTSALPLHKSALGDIRILHDNADSFAEAYAATRPELNSTNSYKNKPRQLLAELLRWQHDPKSYTARPPRTRVKPVREKPVSLRRECAYPLDGIRTFDFTLPLQQLTTKEAERIYYHLLTLTSDFDPTAFASRS